MPDAGVAAGGARSGCEREPAIDVLRGIACLLVLLGHSFPDSAYGFVSPASEFWHEYVYSFHMPLFFVISGFCMHHVMAGEDLDLRGQLARRARRLLVPYLFWSIAAILPKLAFASIMYLPFEWSQLPAILLGDSPSGTLWYVWTLFVLNVLFLCFSRLTREPLAWLAAGVAMSLLGGIVRVPYLWRVLDNAVWFAAGALLAAHWPRVRILLSARGGVSLAVLLLAANAALVGAMLAVGWGGVKGNWASSAACLAALLAVSARVAASGGHPARALLAVSRDSFGVYLLSPWPQVAVRVFLWARLGAPYVLCMALMLALGLALPRAALWAVRRPGFPGGEWARLVVGA